MKGIVLRLKATQGDDGKVNIKWAKKNKDRENDAVESEEAVPEKKKKRRKG